MEVPCGQCLGCRLDHSRMWAMRIVHESCMHEHNGGNCFITLTYRDPIECTIEQLEKKQYVPDDWSLNKRHVQLFLKRLRKMYGGKEIRYFYAGEYGKKCKHGLDVDTVGCPLCNVGRPHYHMCLFGHTFDDLEIYHSDYAIERYTSPTLEKLWGYGFVDVGSLTYNSAAYTAKYILKKVKGVNADDHYMTVDMNGEITWIRPEYVEMSRGKTCKAHRGMPYQHDCPNCSRGIGRDWYCAYHDDVFPSDEIPIPGKGVMKGVPRYYNEVLKHENPEMYEEVKKLRKEFMRAHAGEYEHERLIQKHKVKKARVNESRRDL